jgi:hypothetical protein
MEREPGFEAELAARVRHAVAAAEQTVAESEELTAASRAAQDDGSTVRRCAWCNRLLLGHWTPPQRVPGFLARQLAVRTTHGICSDCRRALDLEGH